MNFWVSTPESLERLKLLYDAYTSNGENYLLHSTRLNINEWSDKFPMIEENNGALVRMGTEKVSRKQVFDAFAEVSHSGTLKEVFVSVMAWGFRPDSYGPYRTSVMLSTPRKNFVVDEILLSVADEKDPVRAYRALEYKIHGLGPAFGTKFLYFTSSVENRAPILDAVVANWLWRYGVRDAKGKWITPVGWNAKLYERYVQFCTEVCQQLGIADRGLVEYLMFVDAQYSDFLEQGKAQPEWVSAVKPSGWQS
jgi:hypothetical protein